MADRSAKRTARTERHEMSADVEHLKEAMASLWGPAYSAERASDVMIGWGEKAIAHWRANRAFGSAMNELARRQSQLMMELARSFELEPPTDGARAGQMRLHADKVDRLFDEAADILREAGHIMSEAQVTALNLIKPDAAKGNPRLVATVEDRDAA